MQLDCTLEAYRALLLEKSSNVDLRWVAEVSLVPSMGTEQRRQWKNTLGHMHDKNSANFLGPSKRTFKTGVGTNVAIGLIVVVDTDC